jgi:hypothetical protein
MGDRVIEPLDHQGMFFLSTSTGADGRVHSYSIDVEKAEDSHYSFTPEAMSTLDGYLTTRYAGATLVERLTQFVASFSSTLAAEGALRELDARLGLGVQQHHFDSYDDWD